MAGSGLNEEVGPVPGTRITDQQVYMKIRKSKSQELTAAKAGISERSARRIESAVALPSQSPRRYWRSRADPFAGVWDAEVVPLLKGAPKLMAVTLLRKLQDEHPERFPDGVSDGANPLVFDGEVAIRASGRGSFERAQSTISGVRAWRQSSLPVGRRT